jgi:hypothetical protein
MHTGCGCNGHPAFPCAFSLQARTSLQSSGALRREIAQLRLIAGYRLHGKKARSAVSNQGHTCCHPSRRGQRPLLRMRAVAGASYQDRRNTTNLMVRRREAPSRTMAIRVAILRDAAKAAPQDEGSGGASYQDRRNTTNLMVRRRGAPSRTMTKGTCVDASHRRFALQHGSIASQARMTCLTWRNAARAGSTLKIRLCPQTSLLKKSGRISCPMFACSPPVSNFPKALW